MLLNELHQPKSYKPTEHERMALSVAMVSDTPQMAHQQLIKDPKLEYSATQLQILGFLHYDGEGGIVVTDAGYELAQAQSLWDGDQPTDEASTLAAI